MAKKMERLDQSNDFRPFKFRIQAFTSAFNEALLTSGFTEEELPFKKIRQYLWAQPCISRFNDDGKKAKVCYCVCLFWKLSMKKLNLPDIIVER